MGAWGYSGLESDEALDVKDRWANWEDSGIDGEKIIAKFLNSWGNAVKYGDSITNNEIIAAILLCREKGVQVSSSLKRAAVDAINRELSDSNLDSWSEPEKRAKSLTLLLQDIGGKRKDAQKKSIFSDPVLDYKSTPAARKKLIDSVRKMRNSKIPVSYTKAGFPSFISTLDRFMTHSVSEKDTNIFIEVRRQRLLMLSAYLGLNLNMSDEEVNLLFDKIN